VRIIAGRLKGRRLQAPPGRAVRPTSDSLRETLFNVLGPSVAGARVLDAFAGTGALALEALSRGAVRATCVEQDPRTLRVLNDNVRACGMEEACDVVRDDFLRTTRVSGPFDLVLLDPPYDIPDLQAVVDGAAALAAGDGRMVLEHSRRRASPEMAGAFRRVRVLTAGDSCLSFYTRDSA